MKHDRPFEILCQCSDCLGHGTIEMTADVGDGRSPWTFTVPCPECAGSGEVMVIPYDTEAADVRS